MRIKIVVDADTVRRGAHLFDDPLLQAATERFLASPDHHLLFAFNTSGRAVGMISGVETTHPDKGTEMFVYELGVEDDYRRQGIGAALVRALEALASERGCYGMWVGVDPENKPALATYRRASAVREESAVTFTWDLGEVDKSS